MQVYPPVTPHEEHPRKFVDVGNEYRLIRELRGRARFQDPTLILAHSAVELFKGERAKTPGERQDALEMGTAIADLAVTGRQTYNKFKNGISLLSLEGTVRQRLNAHSTAPLNP